MKLNIQKAMVTASSSITSQQREREKMETVTDFIFLGSKIIDIIFKSRDITFLTKVSTTKAIIFPVVTYECKSWTLKKAECQRIGAFEV